MVVDDMDDDVTDTDDKDSNPSLGTVPILVWGEMFFVSSVVVRRPCNERLPVDILGPLFDYTMKISTIQVDTSARRAKKCTNPGQL